MKTDPAADLEGIDVHPRHWYSTNLVGLPAPLLASVDFQRHPVPLAIAGTREAHAGLFALLDRSSSLSEARDVFRHYLSIAFGLPRPGEIPDPTERRRWRASYLKLLHGWGQDANGPAGAVCKGWVESRFGLVPGFHRAPLGHFPSPAWMRYLEEKASSRFHNNCIHQQLDLLYEFCQWTLQRFEPLGSGPHVTLWRGSNQCDEQIVHGHLRAGLPRRSRRVTVRLNNLVSFALSREQADCFGDWILSARIPLCKLLFYPGLLDTRTLDGEGEALVIGGDCDLEASYA
ncbi:NAD+--dinitrogen-reductase ADP-D-ribosyltransferase [Sphaerotilus hippei]|uniref:NAD+--dinitrogen-reductase ADP-D-ribosyltransferase n=1 Tax=Sphaerotilus hippei TaxID=744406 RepID=A0A318H1E4_9BURK|nr:NAD(+)--dinitrogen-reductase ADP-D-ribosyltransferase [Sphaerotilus hippei]PXW94360.1 NAD+--dinitrogen-reductase ADP-D-ribosyltransferase [Sphaerotilus hippei]